MANPFKSTGSPNRKQRVCGVRELAMDMFHLLRHECCVGCAAAAVAALSPVVTGLTAIARVLLLPPRRLGARLISEGASRGA